MRKLIASFGLLLAAYFALAEICVNVPSVGTGTGPTNPPPESTNPPTFNLATSFPVEVLGPPGSIEEIPLVLSSGASTVTGLKLLVHGLTYENKMSVRLNGGAWKTLNDTNVTMPDKERGFWGMGGILDTLRMTVPLTAGEVVNGTNLVAFRFNDLDGKTIGFRVLSANLVAGSTELIPTNSFAYDDPALWTLPAPYQTPQAISEGQHLWYNETISEAGRTLLTHCTDCHAHDGRDLRYFNYSRKSIVERSRFHGLTADQGNKIASFIHSRPVTYEPDARPYNPPYQPAPGLDAKPVRSWAAGAGLGAVLENDTDMLAYIFPGGATTNSVNIAGASLNPREIPLNVQFPSWNRWLPKVHPLDQYPTIYATNVYLSQYRTMTNTLAGMTDPIQKAAYINDQSSPWDSAAGKTGIVKPSTSDPGYALWAENERDKRHWRAVKVWELMHEHGAEDKGFEVIGSTNLYGRPLQDRRWFHGEIFRLGPHVIGLVKDDKFHAESMQWYQVQLALNDGNRDNPSIVPIDWGYQHALNVSAWDNPVGLPTPQLTWGIVVLNCYKGLEVSATGYPPASTGTDRSFNPLKADIYRLAPGNTLRGKYFSIPNEVRRPVVEALLLAWVKECERLSRDDYLAKKNWALTDSFRSYIYGVATTAEELSIDPAIQNRIVDFGLMLYPTFDWSGARP